MTTITVGIVFFAGVALGGVLGFIAHAMLMVADE